ncbi:hypothetical protein Back11_20570 [Paenibacillus baekrokdamisoli]|uniref:Uncharacterized protein n=1 Tax=Paenibacillus baekrokdamisoli TaxID=1712516 RepID=A0A3G9IR12_9BACL|nr:hypothetical protein [Paenibacillus baekrokdamisoli]MBB3069935.1 hypothetical protein [Paenibacillus baekrokdamisoli]BBH20712.1 hypothetical protein Back11_20570 [Paenibacillus baekrokdamisoli]
MRIVILAAALVSGVSLYGLMLAGNESTAIKLVVSEAGSFIIFYSGYYLLQMTNKKDQQIK